MTARKRNWIVAISLAVTLVGAGLIIAGSILTRRIEPLARQTAIRYLNQRFDCDAQLQTLHIRLPKTSLFHLILTLGRGIWAHIDGEGLSMRMRNRPDAVPLFVIQKFHGEVSVESLLHPPVFVSQIVVDGMQIQIPPRGERPHGQASSDTGRTTSSSQLTIGKVGIHNATLTLQPKDPHKTPLQFDIQNVELQSVRAGAPMRYDVSMANAKPPGRIHATGEFGPWVAGEPGETPLNGDYIFEKADLGVFHGIAGTLNSTGKFEGQLASITVRGQASVPNFQLRISGNPVPLFARFTAVVDGTNGNTILQPVTATLGSTNFTTSGGIIKHEANQPRTISLKASMPDGNMRDVLRLAMKGTPFMEGRLALTTKIDVPPLTGKVREKIELDGSFELLQGKFLHSTIQNQIDGLSKRARGEAENPDSEEAVTHMMGVFHLENASIHFRKLSFGIPGANLDLAGDYNLDSDVLDFGGTLKLQATVSQMVTGWKSVILKPVDRFFEKKGAGTFLRIRIDGTSKAPKLGVILAGKRLEAPVGKR